MNGDAKDDVYHGIRGTGRNELEVKVGTLLGCMDWEDNLVLCSLSYSFWPV